jgi:predicted HTH domain antitoxin
MTTVQVRLPEDTVRYFGVPEQDVGRTILEECAANLYREAKISLVQGKRMLGLESIQDFMHVLTVHETPVIDYDIDDFERELKLLNINYRPAQGQERC